MSASIKSSRPSPPLCSLDCKTQPYGEIHGSLPNRFPQQPRQNWQAPRSPDWGVALCWLPMPPLTQQGRPLSAPVGTCCLGGADASHPAGVAAGHLGLPSRPCPGPASLLLASLQPWQRAQLGKALGWPSGECPSRVTQPQLDK